MGAWIASVWQMPSVKHFLIGAATGVAISARQDLEAFRKWQSFTDMKKFDWNIAGFKYLKAAVIGGLGTTSLGAFLG